VAVAPLIVGPLALLVVFALIPIGLTLVETLTSETGAFPSVSRYAAFFADGYSRANLLYTIVQTLVSTLTVLTASLIIALQLRFGRGRVSAVIQGLALFPLFVPGIIVAYALIRFLGPNGSLQILLEHVGLTGWFRSPYLTPTGPFLGFVWENLPLPVLILTAGLAQVSGHGVEAARDLGAGIGRILVEIILPQVQRSLLIAFSLTFLSIFGAYTVPYLLGPAAPEMMGVFMQRTYSNLGEPVAAEVQAVLSFLICAVVAAFYVHALTQEQGATEASG
jgi:ABC-type spermidine/putrescine transport system permease subunit I